MSRDMFKDPGQAPNNIKKTMKLKLKLEHFSCFFNIKGSSISPRRLIFLIQSGSLNDPGFTSRTSSAVFSNEKLSVKLSNVCQKPKDLRLIRFLTETRLQYPRPSPPRSHPHISYKLAWRFGEILLYKLKTKQEI